MFQESILSFFHDRLLSPVSTFIFEKPFTFDHEEDMYSHENHELEKLYSVSHEFGPVILMLMMFCQGNPRALALGGIGSRPPLFKNLTFSQRIYNPSSIIY